jgi:alpha-1,3-rhamnosyl/mannosyltransferase
MKSIAADAALQFDPNNVEAIRAALQALTTDPDVRRCLIAAGPQRAAKFSWAAAACATLKSLHSAV